MKNLLRKIKNAIKSPSKVTSAIKTKVETKVTSKDDLIKLYRDSLSEEPGYVTKIHDEDFIFQFLFNHPGFETRVDTVHYYFNDSKKSADTLNDLVFDELKLAKQQGVSILEFACGYGAVTRHLSSLVSPAELVSSDIHQAANEFISKELGVRTIQSSSSPDGYPMDEKFDVVFALSFFSHMPMQTWSEWLKTLYSLVKDGGHLIFTTQGLESRKFHGDPEIPENGFWFASNSEQKDLDVNEYGQTIVTVDYVTREVSKVLGVPVKIVKEACWWEHQDLYVVQKPSNT